MMATMLESQEAASALDTRSTDDGSDVTHEQVQRLQDELKFAKTTIAALNFEIARLKRWRFGQSSESLDTQAPLFEAITADTQLEDAAALAGKGSRAGAPRRAVRQALPSG